MPYPKGARRLSGDGVADLDGFVDGFYSPEARSSMRPLVAARGFNTAVHRTWANADGTQAELWVVEFTSPHGADSQYLSVSSAWKQAEPTWTFADTTVNGTGELVPTLDAAGFTDAKDTAVVGQIFIYVRFFSVETPDQRRASTLMHEQAKLAADIF